MTNTEVSQDKIKADLDLYKSQNPQFKDYYSGVNQLNTESLQEAACQRDRAYLKKVSTLLHIIMSIVSHPHIANKREEIVTRIEQAKQLSNEDFSKVLRDGSLWKRYDMKMVPENVYYYQNVDELAIYENQFVVLVINLIKKELEEYSSFYVKMLPSMKKGFVPRLDGSKPQRILAYNSLLKRRINYLANSHFYKEVSLTKPISRNVVPTNILLKDNLYSRVYRFYREYLGKEERFISYGFLNDYLSAFIYKDLAKRKFVFVGNDNQKAFKNDNFYLTAEDYGNKKGIIFTVTEKLTKVSSKHLLMFSLSAWFSDIEKAPKGYDTVEAMSVWGKINFDKNKESIDEIFSEEDIVKNYFDEKLCLSITSAEVYSRYCPVCREQNPIEQKSVYFCPHCSSKYLFTKSGDDNAVWFLRLRRSK